MEEKTPEEKTPEEKTPEEKTPEDQTIIDGSVNDPKNFNKPGDPKSKELPQEAQEAQEDWGGRFSEDILDRLEKIQPEGSDPEKNKTELKPEDEKVAQESRKIAADLEAEKKATEDRTRRITADLRGTVRGVIEKFSQETKRLPIVDPNEDEQ